MTHSTFTQDSDRVRAMLSHLIERLEEEINNPKAGSKHGYLWGRSDAATMLVRLTNLLIKLDVKKNSSDFGHNYDNEMTPEEQESAGGGQRE